MSEVDKEQEDASNQGADVAAEAAEAADEHALEVPEADIESLREQLAAANEKAEANWNEVLRARAEMDNLRKRQERELDGARKYALESFVGELLQVRDSLELGIQAAQGDAADIKQLLEGTDLTLKLLGGVMTKFGVERLDPEGQPFNPDFHQAMSVQPRDDVPPNTVVAVIQKGYTLNGRLVRPALVMVSQAAGGG